jgi:hypothetical protein
MDDLDSRVVTAWKGFIGAFYQFGLAGEEKRIDEDDLFLRCRS